MSNFLGRIRPIACRINAQQLVIMGGINLLNAESLDDIWLFDANTEELHNQVMINKERKIPKCYSFGNQSNCLGQNAVAALVTA